MASRVVLRLVALGLVAILGAACDSGPTVKNVRELHTEHRYEESIDPLRELLDLHPDDAEINYLYGYALNRTTSSTVAVWALKKSAEDPAWTVRALLELATGQMQISNWAEVITSTQQLLERDPENLTALGLRGMAYLNDEKTADLALEDFEKMLDIAPEDRGAQVSRAAALLRLGEVGETEAALTEIAATGGNEASPLTQSMLCTTRSVLLWEKDEIEAATARFDECLKAHPRNALLLDQAMAFFDAQSQRGRATELLEGALESAPGDALRRQTLSARVAEDGDLERAEAILREGTQLPDPRSRSAAWVALTNFLLTLDDLSGAIVSYDRALALTKTPSQLAILTYADLLARAERNDEALEFARKLSRESYRSLVEARVHLNLHQPAKALASLEKVFPTWPNNAGARYYAARAAEQLGDFTRAIEEYRQSIRSAPEQTDAGVRLAKLYLAAGALQNAWNHGIQHFRANPKDEEAIRVLLRAATSADQKSVKALFQGLRGGPLFPTAVAIRASMIRDQDGVDAALTFLSETGALDLTRPENAEALRTRVDLELESGQIKTARAEIDAALLAHPETAAFHEIHGRVLAAEDATGPEIRGAYARAVEIAPNSSIALESLGRHHLRNGDYATAIDLLNQATAADPYADSPGRAAANALSESGQVVKAQTAWDIHLREHPWDAAAALAWNRLRLADGIHDDLTLQLAERAVLFQGGIEAQRRLILTHQTRGELDRVRELTAAMKGRKPLAPLQITPIDGV